MPVSVKVLRSMKIQKEPYGKRKLKIIPKKN
jgi:hypothetical protein